MAVISDQDPALLGPYMGYYSTKSARNALDGFKDQGIAKALALVVWRGIKARLRGDDGRPFFDANGRAVVVPRILTLEERNAAKPD